MECEIITQLSKPMRMILLLSRCKKTRTRKSKKNKKKFCKQSDCLDFQLHTILATSTLPLIFNKRLLPSLVFIQHQHLYHISCVKAYGS